MTIVAVAPGVVRRSDRGLALAGTRITLYDVMDYLKQDWPPNLIRDWLGLTDEQIGVALAYIAEHGEECTAEYQQVLQDAEDLWHYYEPLQAAHMRAVANRQRTPEEAALRARFEELKARKGIR